MEPQIIDYYNEYPHMMKIIEKLNEEYDELYNENQSLNKEIDRLRNMYEPEPDLNRLIDFSIKTGGKHYDIAKVFHCIYKNEFKCTSLKKKNGITNQNQSGKNVIQIIINMVFNFALN